METWRSSVSVCMQAGVGCGGARVVPERELEQADCRRSGAGQRCGRSGRALGRRPRQLRTGCRDAQRYMRRYAGVCRLGTCRGRGGRMVGVGGRCSRKTGQDTTEGLGQKLYEREADVACKSYSVVNDRRRMKPVVIDEVQGAGVVVFGVTALGRRCSEAVGRQVVQVVEMCNCYLRGR